jgi:hypothetical protein
MAAETYDLYSNCDHLPTSIGIGLIVGGTGSGKTQLLMDMLTRRMACRGGPYWHKVIFLCPTAALQKQYFSGFPERDVHTNPDEFAGILNQVVDHQTTVDDPKPICIVMDDVIGCMRGKKDAEFVDKFNRLVTSGRHIKVFVIVLTQYLKDRIFSSTLVRGNLAFLAGAASGLSDVNLSKFVELLSEGKDKGEKIVATAAGENYRFVARDFAPDSKNPGKRVSMIKVDPSQIPKLTIRYRD